MIGGFSSLYPGVAALYFIGMLMLIMWLNHPLYLVTSLLSILLLNFSLDGGAALKKSWRGYLLMMGVVMVLNPLFSSRGATILFYLRNRPVTLESVLYGIIFALTLVTVLTGFQAYQQIITVDKFLYLTGSVLPRTAFVIVMILRLMPLLRRRLKDIKAIAKTLGRMKGNNRRQRIGETMEQINTLLVWTMEESLHTAVAMRASGYGSGPRSSFRAYRREARDYWMTVLLLAVGLAVFAGGFQGAGRMVFYPAVAGLSVNGWHYALFLCWCTVPVLMNVLEMIQWQLIKLKM